MYENVRSMQYLLAMSTQIYEKINEEKNEKIKEKDDEESKKEIRDGGELKNKNYAGQINE